MTNEGAGRTQDGTQLLTFLEEMMRTIARVDLGQSGWRNCHCSRCDF